MPIVYMEMIMGQYSQSGAVSVWRVCPGLKGKAKLQDSVYHMYIIYGLD